MVLAHGEAIFFVCDRFHQGEIASAKFPWIRKNEQKNYPWQIIKTQSGSTNHENSAGFSALRTVNVFRVFKNTLVNPGWEKIGVRLRSAWCRGKRRQNNSNCMAEFSLRTADAFPVVAFRRERSDDRKCVCGSQARQSSGIFSPRPFPWVPTRLNLTPVFSHLKNT